MSEKSVFPASAGANQQQQDNNKEKYDDKYLYESSRTDSGFISSGNLLISGEIQEEEFKEQNIQQSQQHHQQQQSVVPEEEPMRIDSGLSLSESFTNLKIKSPAGWNDFDEKQTTKSYQEQKPQPQQQQQQVTRTIQWQKYYEQDEDGDTQLHLAIVEGCVEVAIALIRSAAHPRLLDTPNDNCQTPLHLAVKTQQYLIVRYLIVAGARPCVRDHNGDSPLHIATRNGDMNCCKAITEPVQKQERDKLQLLYPEKLIYQTTNLDQWNYIGQTCVHVAAQYGHIDILRHLIYKGADINARDGCNGYTALYYAIEKQNEQLVEFLLNCNQFNPHIECYNKRTALEFNSNIEDNIFMQLKLKGVRAIYLSEDEEESSEDDDEEEGNLYDSKMFVSNLVDASA